jgi:hypothetical protein
LPPPKTKVDRPAHAPSCTVRLDVPRPLPPTRYEHVINERQLAAPFDSIARPSSVRCLAPVPPALRKH